MQSLRNSILLIVALMSAFAVLGCESAQQGGSSPGLNNALTDYSAGRFGAAHDRAVEVQERTTSTTVREDAAYLAGLSAYRLGEIDAAERRLMVATRSTNEETAARAKAMMGQIRLDQNRPRDAAMLFVEASTGLEGEDARHCAYNASVAYQQSGDQASARTWLAKSGMSASTISAPASVPARATMPGASPRTASTGTSASSARGFTLQVGAFKERTRAQQAAAEAQQLATRDGLGGVRVITRRDTRGETMYVVQFGSFSTREAAAAARSKLNRLEYIVTPV